MMTAPSSLLLFLMLAAATFWRARQKMVPLSGGIAGKLTSLPRHYGYHAAALSLLPFSLCWVLWIALGPTLIDTIVFNTETAAAADEGSMALLQAKVKQSVAGAAVLDEFGHIKRLANKYTITEAYTEWGKFLLLFLVGVVSHAISIKRLSPDVPARQKFDDILEWVLFASAAVAILTTLGIVFSLTLESVQFFSKVPIKEFLFGTQWSPQTALREDQIGASGSFGALPLFAGTLLVSLIALAVAGPIGLMTAVYLNHYANPLIRTVVKPLLEILAGIPTVVFGFFAAITIAPLMVTLGNTTGLTIESESALTAGLVMGLMIVPYISSLADDALAAVPKSLIDASFALGATPSETIRRVILPAARQGLTAAILLAVSRAIGETMIVVMAVGMRPNLTANPFETVTTVTVQIVALLTGDQAFDQPKTLSAFALGLVLFTSTLFFNLIGQRFMQRPAYRFAE